MILNLMRKACYIGLTKDTFTRRWSRHRWGLRRNSHECPALQNAWNCDGESAFAFVILETITDKGATTAVEQKWMQHYRALGYALYNEVHNGYSPSPSTRKKLRAAKQGFTPTAAIEAMTKDWSLVTPEGELLHVHNLAAFCREHGLDMSTMRKVLIGKVRSHKGYRAPDSPAPAAHYTPRGRTADRLVCPVCGGPKHRQSATCRACYLASDRFHEQLQRIAPIGNLAANKARWHR